MGAALPRAAAVHQHAPSDWVGRPEGGRHALQCMQGVGRDGRPGFALHAPDIGSSIHEQVDLGTAGLPQVVEGGRETPVGVRLVNLRGHPRLEDRAAQRMRREVRSAPDTEQTADAAGVHPVDLRRPDGPLARVPRPCRQAEDEEARFEDRQPGAGRVVGHARVRAEAGEVQLLGGPPGEEAHEGVQRLELTDREQATHVALQVGLDVVADPAARGDGLVMNAWKAPREQGLKEILRRAGEAAELVDGERQQVHDCRAPREGLRHRPRLPEVLRAGQDPPSRSGIVVDLGLEVGEQVGCVLDLVENGAVRVIGEETPRVRAGVGPIVDPLEVDVRLARKDVASEGGLAGLPGPGDGDDRVLPRNPGQDDGEVAAYVHAPIASRTYNLCNAEFLDASQSVLANACLEVRRGLGERARCSRLVARVERSRLAPDGRGSGRGPSPQTPQPRPLLNPARP